MKKYVLNIDRMFTGQTANALVLDQVDEDFPVLIPSLNDESRMYEFKDKWEQVYRDFSPDMGSLDEFNEYIMNFNLELQQRFKDRGHQELYMMDDTTYRKSNNPDDMTLSYEKTFMHNLNGKASVEAGKDEDTDEPIYRVVNSSQMNVLFPFRKMSSKSMYANQLGIEHDNTIDDALETARGITLQGKVSYENCLQGVAQAGNNLYMMSPTIAVGDTLGGVEGRTIYGNGLTIVNGTDDKPYHFPHTMTLFQPGQDQYVNSTINEFIEWYEQHNHRTMIGLNETYGTNVSTMMCYGANSYYIDLATYGPTDILLSQSRSWGKKDRSVHLDSTTYRELRSRGLRKDGKYIVDNGDFKYVDFLFNLYDTFISGDDRIIQMSIPKDKDFNNLTLKFEWYPLVKGELPKELEYYIYVNEDLVNKPKPDIGIQNNTSRSTLAPVEYSFPITDATISSHDIQIVVRMHFDVDFSKRNNEHGYQEMLKNSGIALRNIRIENGVSDNSENLTFGSYVNEIGISESEHQRRYEQFWEVSRYKKNIAYQTVIESPLKNVVSNSIGYRNNYSSGDLYGDMFVTKSILDPMYDMHLFPIDADDLLCVDSRNYIGLGQCSDQLSLIYRPTTIHMKVDDSTNEKVIMTDRVSEKYDDMKYQMVEVVKNINRFESAIKHKSNVFSVVVENSNLNPDRNVDTTRDTPEARLELFKEQLRDSITQFVRNTCQNIAPVHTQLFDVQFR